jgi:hypothetical protein
MLSGPTAFTTIGDYLLAAVLARLRDNGLEVPNRAAVVPAPIVADECQCGLLAVAVPRIYGSDTALQDPTGGAVAVGPGASYPVDEIPTWLNAEMQVAIMRCADIPDGGVPTADTLAREAVTVHSDAYWVQVAVSCELARLRHEQMIEDYALGDQPFIEPAGSCQGGQYNVTVAIPNECPCP